MKSTDKFYTSLAYDGAPLLCIPLCISSTFLVTSTFTFYLSFISIMRWKVRVRIYVWHMALHKLFWQTD